MMLVSSDAFSRGVDILGSNLFSSSIEPSKLSLTYGLLSNPFLAHHVTQVPPVGELFDRYWASYCVLSYQRVALSSSML